MGGIAAPKRPVIGGRAAKLLAYDIAWGTSIEVRVKAAVTSPPKAENE
jgi:hypothetical protein